MSLLSAMILPVRVSLLPVKSSLHGGPQELRRLQLVGKRVDWAVPSLKCVGMEQFVINHCVFDTAIGPCGVAWSARGLVAVALPEGSHASTERRVADRAGSAGEATPTPAIGALIADVKRYLTGERVDFTPVAVDLSSLDPFRRKLYELMRDLAWGSTTTYGALAQELGLNGW